MILATLEMATARVSAQPVTLHVLGAQIMAWLEISLSVPLAPLATTTSLAPSV